MSGDAPDDLPILVANGDEPASGDARRALVQARRTVRAVRRVDEALRLLSEERFRLALLDSRFEDGDAWPILAAARAATPPIPVIVVTSRPDSDLAAEAMRRGASDCVVATGDLWERLPALVDRVAKTGEAESDNALLASLVQFSDDAILALSLSGVVLSWNPAAESLFGYRSADIVGRSVSILYPEASAESQPDDAETLRRGGRIANRETLRRRQDGVLVEVAESVSPIRDASGRVVGAAVVVRDIRERKSLESQLRHAQKLEAVGRLASGVAHDFNNLLTVIAGYSGLLMERLDDRDPVRREIAEIQRAGERGATLTQQLLAFSRKQACAPRLIGLNAVIGDMERMLRRLIGENVELIVALNARTDLVVADPGQIEQVVVNLAVNAKDAMPDGGRLTISTRCVDLDESYARRHAGVRPGPYVAVAVSDTGSGMDQVTRTHLFEPFFTTKGPGKGTGLGLSTVHGIVTQSGGHIGLYSEQGRGTTFRIYLPAAAAVAAAPSPAAPEDEPPGGTETILLAEDDGGMRRLVRDVLEAHGYDVLEARDGREALEVCERHEGEIHLLLADVVMHALDGPDLAKLVASQRRATKVLFMSGYADAGQARLGPDAAYLEKPFAPADLLRKVREVLQSEPPDAGSAGAEGEPPTATGRARARRRGADR